MLIPGETTLADLTAHIDTLLEADLDHGRANFLRNQIVPQIFRLVSDTFPENLRIARNNFEYATDILQEVLEDLKDWSEHDPSEIPILVDPRIPPRDQLNLLSVGRVNPDLNVIGSTLISHPNYTPGRRPYILWLSGSTLNPMDVDRSLRSISNEEGMRFLNLSEGLAWLRERAADPTRFSLQGRVYLLGTIARLTGIQALRTYMFPYGFPFLECDVNDYMHLNIDSRPETKPNANVLFGKITRKETAQ